MKEIKLTQGQVAIVCDCHAYLVENDSWCAHWDEEAHGFYAVRTLWESGNNKTVYMARVIVNAQKGEIVDHKNHNSLDNQCTNLRKCTTAQNSMNARKRNDNTSGYIGVHYASHAKRWCARITINGRMKNLGYYDTPEEAAHVRDNAALESFGEFASLNFPSVG